jgi:hypothetical protein
MNSKQKVLGFIAIGVFLISVVGAPWRVDYTSRLTHHVVSSYLVYYPVFNPPEPDQKIDYIQVSTLLWQPLLFAWIAIAVVYAGLFFLVRSKRQ